MYQKLLLVGLFSWAMCGCSAPFRCLSERIEVALQAPLQAGDSLAVTSAFNGGGWGGLDLPAGTRAQVSVRADSFVAVSASGSIRVLAVAPLRLRIDVTTQSDNNATIRIRGDANFQFVRERVPCT
jgi:hypothetical protein